MTEIVPSSNTVPLPADTGGLVFTSRNAVRIFAASNARRDLTAWCVGNRTADTAHAAGFERVQNAQGDVIALVALIASASVSGGLVYLRASDVSADLAGLLAARGVSLHSQVIYRAEPGDPAPDDITALLRAGSIGTVAVWSRRAATLLAGHFAENPGWPRSAIDAVAISHRAAHPLESLEFGNISVSSEPTGAAMEAAICVAVRQKSG